MELSRALHGVARCCRRRQRGEGQPGLGSPDARRLTPHLCDTPKCSQTLPTVLQGANLPPINNPQDGAAAGGGRIIFANEVTNKGSVFKINNSSHNSRAKEPNTPVKGLAGNLNRHFCKEDLQMTKTCTRWSTSLIIRETQMQTTVRHHLTPVRSHHQKSINSKFWRGCGEKGTLLLEIHPNCISKRYITKTWEQHKCPLTDEWIKEDVVHIYKYIQRSTTQPTKQNKMRPFAATCMDLEIIILSEVCQTDRQISVYICRITYA